jgi:hypothetical protein
MSRTDCATTWRLCAVTAHGFAHAVPRAWAGRAVFSAGVKPWAETRPSTVSVFFEFLFGFKDFRNMYKLQKFVENKIKLRKI